MSFTQKKPFDSTQHMPIFSQSNLKGIEKCTDLEEIERVRSEVLNICSWNEKGFPGSQPVSIAQHNFRFLIEKTYQVSLKTNGIR